MKRKTNLFYNTSEDTNFVTFSNYTESMTGNYLSTNTKIFPSKFLCLYIPNLDNDNANKSKRLSFVRNYLCGKYENKLATLRDYCKDNNYNCEEKLKPLNYLLEDIYKYDAYTYISFIGEITEQDYNGIYADTICNINLGATVNGTVNFDNDYTSSYIITVDTDMYKLHGWENTNMPTDYDITPQYDNIVVTSTYVSNRYDITYGTSTYNTYENIFSYTAQYYMGSSISSIDINEDYTATYIMFNAVIPLYDTVNININNNITIINETENKFDLSDNAGDWYYKNVPMGMWFADSLVKLTRESGINNFAPSWSLVLSSQFKPFPYSNQIPDEITTSSTSDAYQTFSQILIKQNEILDKFNEVINVVANLSERLSNVEGQLNTTGCAYSLDNVHLEMIDWESKMTKKYNDIIDNVSSYISGLTWKYRQG